METRRRRVRRWLGCLTLMSVSLTSAPAVAQSSSSVVAGVVRDASGKALPGARLQLENPDTGQVRYTISGGGGEYEFAGLLPAARLTLEVRSDGFRATRRAIHAMTSGERRVVDVLLDVAGLDEAIQVTADTALGRTSRPSSEAICGASRSIASR